MTLTARGVTGAEACGSDAAFDDAGVAADGTAAFGEARPEVGRDRRFVVEVVGSGAVVAPGFVVGAAVDADGCGLADLVGLAIAIRS